MLDFLKKLVNSTPIVTPNEQRQQANINAMNAVSDFQNYLKGNLTTNDFSQPSLDMINKIGADKVAEGVEQGLNNGIPEIASWIDQYNKGVGRNNPLGVQQAPTQVQNPVLTANVVQQSDPKTKLMNALNDFSAGYKENATQPFSVNNLTPRLTPQDFKASINPENYRTQLTSNEQKNFDAWAKDMKTKGLINANDNFQDYDMQGYWKNEVLNNTNLANGNAQAHFTDKYKMPNHETFSNESMYATGDNAKYAGYWDNGKFIAPRNENIMTKLGEGVGTAMRVLDNPLTKSLIVGGLVSATGGNPVQALGYGIKTGSIAQNAQMRNQLYRQKLKSLGYSDEDLDKIRGYIGDNEYKTISDGVYRSGMLDYRNGMLNNLQDKLLADIDYKNKMIDYKNGMLDVAKQNAKTNEKKANIYQQIANNRKSSGGLGSGKPQGSKGSGAKNPMYGKHLAEYNSIVQSGDVNKVAYARSKFIETYGEDPDKSLKKENDILDLLEALKNE